MQKNKLSLVRSRFASENNLSNDELRLFDIIMHNKSEPVAEVVCKLYLAEFDPSSITRIASNLAPKLTKQQLTVLLRVVVSLDSSTLPNHFPIYKPKPFILGYDYSTTSYFYEEKFAEVDLGGEYDENQNNSINDGY